MEWLNIMPLPVALGMVIYVNNRLEKHAETCPFQQSIDRVEKKVDMILDHLLNKR